MLAQLKKGVLEFCILNVIFRDEYYGYEIMKLVSSIFVDTSEQTVYSILRRLLADGYTECFSKDISNGPPRKYYRLTKKGAVYLEESRKDWRYVSDCVEKFLSI